MGSSAANLTERRQALFAAEKRARERDYGRMLAEAEVALGLRQPTGRTQKMGMRKLSDEDRDEICRRIDAGETTAAIAADFGIDRTHVNKTYRQRVASLKHRPTGAGLCKRRRISRRTKAPAAPAAPDSQPTIPPPAIQEQSPKKQPPLQPPPIPPVTYPALGEQPDRVRNFPQAKEPATPANPRAAALLDLASALAHAAGGLECYGDAYVQACRMVVADAEQRSGKGGE